MMDLTSILILLLRTTPTTVYEYHSMYGVHMSHATYCSGGSTVPLSWACTSFLVRLYTSMLVQHKPTVLLCSVPNDAHNIVMF